MGDVIADAVIDTLWVVPFLLVMNFAIELLEYRAHGVAASKLLRGGFAPALGTAVGTVPQCGFSVVATELYSKRKVALGTLIAVYIATSDEALPIMLSSLDGLSKVAPVLIIKIVASLLAGYAIFAVQKLMRKPAVPSATSPNDEHAHGDEHGHGDEHEHDGEHIQGDRSSDPTEDGAEHLHFRGCHRHALDDEPRGDEPLTGKAKAARIWHTYFEHPLLHTATVAAYILLVNLAFGTLVYFVGEQSIAAFLSRTGYFQPVLAAAVGLIPNCAASVVITELYVVGGLNLGGAVAGLCVSAGLGYAVLIKQNRPFKNSLLIILCMFVGSAALGIAVNAIAPLIVSV